MISRISSKVRELVNDYSVSDHYGGWGILTSDQRITIRLLCDTCDNFEKTADILVEENNRLKKELELMKGGEGVMNHDATHCLDHKSSCPKSCYRGQLTEDLRKICYPLPTSWAHYDGTKECPKTKKGGEG